VKSRLLRGVLAATTLSFLAVSAAIPQAAIERMEVNASQIDNFRIGLSQTKFGPLEFVGGLEMTSPGRNFGSLSAFRFQNPGRNFIGVADTGFWFFGRVERDANGVPTGVSNFRMREMTDRTGKPIGEKWRWTATTS
jgi:hypothetical protein